MIAFKSYQPAAGFDNAEWVGLAHIIDFFKSYYFIRLLKNTLRISLTSLIFGFPAPILLALLLNEVKSAGYKRLVQTVTYFLHFLSIKGGAVFSLSGHRFFRLSVPVRSAEKNNSEKSSHLHSRIV